MLVKRLSFATILLANSSFNDNALVNSWSCRPSSAWRKACWETIVESDGELESESSIPSAARPGSLVLWLTVSWSWKATIQLLTKRSHENQAHAQLRIHKQEENVESMNAIYDYNLTGEGKGEGRSVCYAFIQNFKIFRSIQRVSVYSFYKPTRRRQPVEFGSTTSFPTSFLTTGSCCLLIQLSRT